MILWLITYFSYTNFHCMYACISKQVSSVGSTWLYLANKIIASKFSYFRKRKSQPMDHSCTYISFTQNRLSAHVNHYVNYKPQVHCTPGVNMLVLITYSNTNLKQRVDTWVEPNEKIYGKISSCNLMLHVWTLRSISVQNSIRAIQKGNGWEWLSTNMSINRLHKWELITRTKHEACWSFIFYL